MRVLGYELMLLHVEVSGKGRLLIVQQAQLIHTVIQTTLSNSIIYLVVLIFN